MVANGEKSQVIAVMEQLAPGVAAKFQEITGRQCVALSVHFDSNMPHWNIWHSGVERVIFPVGKTERERYRRTAFDLNSSGNLLAWHRTQLAFERLGKDFRALSSPTVKELERGLNRAMERQGRPPGDWTMNETADSLLESALRDMGKVAEIEAGFKEFVENEERRYRDGTAGREPKDTRKLAGLIQDHESVAEAIKRLKRADEIIEIEKEISQVRSILELAPEKPLAAAARQLAERAKDAEILKKRVAKLRSEGEEICAENETLTRKVDELENQLECEKKKVHRLEEEIAPLRRLRERVQEFLLRLMKSPLTQKFEVGLKSLLCELGKLVGIPFNLEKKDTTREQDRKAE
ncbi:MAG: hypothetical protein BGO12_13400 [Verrucomicrobia bacterium 61-8]|nr:MAG: hypothetical protein BGO12_13400 [Verrucomicrobia bacterium 61-8]